MTNGLSKDDDGMKLANLTSGPMWQRGNLHLKSDFKQSSRNPICRYTKRDALQDLGKCGMHLLFLKIL